MKTKFLKSITVLIMLAFALSCSSDSDSSTPCIPVTCLNGGTSTANCGCNCPTGYTGNNCGSQLTPTKINISKVEIYSFPTVDPSAVTGFWDYVISDPTQNAPDIAIVLYDSGSNILLDTTSNPFMNASNSVSHSYTITPALQITNVTQLFTIRLLDIDPPSSAQTMNTYFFTMYDSNNHFPSIIYLDNGETKYKLYVTYTW